MEVSANRKLKFVDTFTKITDYYKTQNLNLEGKIAFLTLITYTNMLTKFMFGISKFMMIFTSSNKFIFDYLQQYKAYRYAKTPFKKHKMLKG